LYQNSWGKVGRRRIARLSADIDLLDKRVLEIVASDGALALCRPDMAYREPTAWLGM
jgi:hypothetical protein